MAEVEELLADDACEYVDTDEAILEAALDAASDVIYVLSGGLYTGQCVATVRPIQSGGMACFGTDNALSAMYGVDVIPLPDEVAVTSVKVDGTTLDSSDYGLFDGRYLYRKDGTSWPRTNTLWKASTEDGTFELTLTIGGHVDWMVKGAVIETALQLLDDANSPRSYLRNVTSGNVQGASVSLDGAAEEVAAKGLPRVSRLLGAMVAHSAQPMGAWAPELEGGWQLVTVT